MNRTKTILTSISLALACTGLGCSDTLDGAEDGLTLNQVVDDDSRVDVDGGVSPVDAGRVRGADAGDAGDRSGGDAGVREDEGDDGDEDSDEGCRLRDWLRRRRGEGRALDGGLGIPGFGGSGRDHDARRERPAAHAFRRP